jgi:hypothetical protein
MGKMMMVMVLAAAGASAGAARGADEMATVCGLSADQRTATAGVEAEMLRARDEYVAAHGAELAAAQKALADAAAAKDAQKLAAAQDETDGGVRPSARLRRAWCRSWLT